MTHCSRITGIVVTAVAVVATPVVHGEELARIATHSQRYGAHIGISAYDDPLLKGVTCYVSGMHRDGDLGSVQPGRTSDAVVACQQVDKLSTPIQIPAKAQVFDESVDPVFKAVHVIRILDAKRLTVLYVSYTESELAGNLPGHVDVIRLQMRGKRTGQ
ncbi:CreA family protein [Paraburkholderia sp. MMS20-SJTN17]|uniref:CreA family protein n=1 Tax=Paraburkholderia translucens TaxID=2886945 RepID=A0ABS8KA66_9BURK|nr:CreA family protein [Paraburkholderia sp. MMS20-SJTN17]MCC8401651.1 CreA family protein [Paraburkholderia sp. MMS20-SJTN17]